MINVFIYQGDICVKLIDINKILVENNLPEIKVNKLE
jgi:hypothetical protein